jgi:hypothetical protein
MGSIIHFPQCNYLYQKNRENPNGNNNQQDFTFTDQTNDLKVKYIINSFDIIRNNKNSEDIEDINIRNLDLYLLIKLKNPIN